MGCGTRDSVAYQLMRQTLDPALCQELVERVETTLYYPPSTSGGEAEPGGEHYRLSGDAEVRPLFEPRLTDRFPGPWVYVDLITIYPKGWVHLHTDTSHGRVRWHLVLQTNPDAWCFAGGVWSHLPAGTVWTIDTEEPHGSVNWGREPRLHLIFDVATGTTPSRPERLTA